MTPSWAWQAAVALLCGFAIVSLGVWAIAGRDQHSLLAVGLVIGVGGLAVILALRAATHPPLRLRWDGAGWHLSGPAPFDGPGCPGTLQVSMDLGPWMLVRFVNGTGWRRRVQWVALQRSTQGAQWHAIRCAVFAGTREPDGP